MHYELALVQELYALNSASNEMAAAPGQFIASQTFDAVKETLFVICFPGVTHFNYFGLRAARCHGEVPSPSLIVTVRSA